MFCCCFFHHVLRALHLGDHPIITKDSHISHVIQVYQKCVDKSNHRIVAPKKFRF